MSGGSVTQRRMEKATRNLTKWCAEHTVEHERSTLGGQPMELLLWRKPDSGFYLMRYMCFGPRLIVTGDMGEAIYSRAPGLEWWAGLHLDYFASKCEASEHGRNPKEWDADEVESRVKGLFRDYMRNGERGLWRRFKELDGPEAFCDRYEWARFLERDGEEFFGVDWWEHYDVSMVVSMSTAYHLAGLKLAMAQLRRTVEAAA